MKSSVDVELPSAVQEARVRRSASALERAPVRSHQRLRRGWLMRRILSFADVLGLVAAFAATEIVIGSTGAVDPIPLEHEVILFVLTLPFWILGARTFGLYDRDEERASHSTADDLVRVFLLITVGAWIVTQMTQVTAAFSLEPLKMTFFWASAVTLVTVARVSARSIARRSSAYRQRTLVVGGGDVGMLVARKLLMHPEYGIDVIGVVDDDPKPAPTWLQQVPVVGGVEDLTRLVDELDVERVVYGFTNDRHDLVLDSIRRLRDAGVQVDVVPRFYEVMGPKVDVHEIEGLALVGLPAIRLPRSSALIKRTLDILIAGPLLVLLSPLMGVLAILVRRSSSGPAFFRQERLGRDMKPFSVLKFRTMKADTDDSAHRAFIAASMDRGAVAVGAGLQDGGLFKLSREDAITPLGRWLRKTSLDELPQLINVLRGEMSLVGPRPCLPYEIEHFEPHHFERFLVPAGLTGLWQVSARAHASFVEALDLDVLYAHSATIGLDLRLLIRTPLQVLRRGATT